MRYFQDSIFILLNIRLNAVNRPRLVIPKFADRKENKDLLVVRIVIKFQETVVR